MSSPTLYNNIWTTHWGHVQEFGPTHVHVRRLLHALAKTVDFSTVLDAGCGNGVNMRFFLDRFPNIRRMTGCDISDVALRRAGERCPEATLHHCDIQKQTLGERFDLIYSSDVLEHLDDDRAALKNMATMCDRFLLVSTLQGRMRRFEKQIGHVRNYRRGELEGIIVEAGFTIRKKIEWGWPFFSPMYRNLLDCGSINDKTATGSPWIRRCIGVPLYWLFLLNRNNRGDIICILAETVRAQDRDDRSHMPGVTG